VKRGEEKRRFLGFGEEGCTLERRGAQGARKLEGTLLERRGRKA
jgi:hypothetical protein